MARSTPSVATVWLGLEHSYEPKIRTSLGALVCTGNVTGISTGLPNFLPLNGELTNRMRRGVRLKTLFAISLLAVSAAAHALVIDSFTDGFVNLNALTVSGASDLRAATAVGNSRATYIGQTTSNGSLASNLTVDAGGYSISNSIGTVSQSSVGYGVTSTSAGGGFGFLTTTNFSLAGFNAFTLQFTGNDQPLLVQVQVANDSTDDIYQRTVAGGQFSPFTVTITAADLISGTGTNLNQFDILRFDFFGSNAGDFQVKQIAVVPEPATISVALIGLVCLRRRRRTRR